MSRKKISTTIYLEPRQVSSLARLSKATRIPQAVLIREGIDAVLEKRKHEIPPEETDPRQTTIPGTR